MSKPPGGRTELAASLTRLAALLLSVEDAGQALRTRSPVAVRDLAAAGVPRRAGDSAPGPVPAPR